MCPVRWYFVEVVFCLWEGEALPAGCNLQLDVETVVEKCIVFLLQTGLS